MRYWRFGVAGALAGWLVAIGGVAKANDKDERFTVAVLDVRAPAGTSKDFADALVDIVPQALDELGAFKAISRNDVADLLELDKMKQTVGCDDLACMAEVGGALGAEYMIAGSIVALNEGYLLQFRLSKVNAGRVVQRVAREYRGSAPGLLDEVRTVTQLLVRDLLSQKAGQLALRVGEEGATIKIDGAIVGTSPLGAQTLSGGVHTVVVEKQGFIQFSRDVRIEQHKTTDVEVQLLPSEEFRRQYIEASTRTRRFAWLGIGGGALGLAGAAALYVIADAQASDLERDIAVFNADPARRTSKEQDELNARRLRVGALDATTLVSAGVGIAAVATGLWLYFTGDDPDHFDKAATSTNVAVSLSVGVTPNALCLSGAF